MRGNVGRILLATVVAALALVMVGAPASARVGARFANADGDTAGKCMDLDGWGTNERVHMVACNNAPNQDWFFKHYSGGFFTIRSYDADAANECLSDTGGGQVGIQVRVVACGVDYSQLWDVVEWSGTWYYLYNYGTGLCLDVRDYGMSNVVQTVGCRDVGSQRWKQF